ncbi:50S ribosomal protein L15 [Candidatus Parcubacteria bacterium]|nr:50S ribosomal protein L15 [Candidatus Parcubacteria bacterium]
MQINQIKPKHKAKQKKRIGRGGKRGTYSGRGMKGQRSRAGRTSEPIIRGLIKRYPKLRGYKFNKWKVKPTIVNISSLEQFKDGDKISPSVLFKKEIIRRIKGKALKVKILGNGKLTKSLTIEGCDVSKSAKEKIEKAGGTII